MSRLRLGCDIGGTFTDFVLFDEDSGVIWVNKCLTTPADPSEGVEIGIAQLVDRLGNFVPRLAEIIHGTTLVINAIIERKGAKTGLITTKGFKDVLELGREWRYDPYDIFAEYPPPLVPRPLRKEVNERVLADGRVWIPLNEEEVVKVIEELKKDKVESLAVCLINSFVNPVHELKVKEIVTRCAPDIFLSISYEVLPQIREYERTSTTVANAYAKPITARYMTKLEERLQRMGFHGKLLIMLSSGGITSVQTAKEHPVRIIESGPTAAVMAAQYYAHLFGLPHVFCFDMGGTTAKSCLIERGHAGVVSTFEVGRVQRFKKGSGLPIQVPVVDLMEIGAGGGSIARVNKLGLLQVGPESAGADPGPVCYGRGGKEPTVTDADLVLGYLNADYFLGGEMKLDKNGAVEAIRILGDRLNLSLVKTAFGIHDLVNETMAAAARTHIAEKGGNPSIVTIVAFGGAGPVHAYGLAKKIGACRIIIPPLPGVGSALGFFTAPVSFDRARSYKVLVDKADFSFIEGIFRELEFEAESILRSVRDTGDIQFERSLEMRFVGQGFETSVPINAKPFNEWTKEEIKEIFRKQYERLYGRTYPDTPIEFVTFKVRATLLEKPFKLPLLRVGTTDLSQAVKGKREAYSLLKKDFITYTVYDRYKLFAGARIRGPAIVEEKESTTVIGEDAEINVDEYGFLWIEIKG